MIGCILESHRYTSLLVGSTYWTIRYATTIICSQFSFSMNAFRLQNHIVSTCMNTALDNSNTCISYTLAFYRYMYSIDIYRTINFSIKQLSGSNINDEQIAIVNN